MFSQRNILGLLFSAHVLVQVFYKNGKSHRALLESIYGSDLTMDPKKIVADQTSCNYIVASSSFFLVPAAYGFKNKLIFLPFLLTVLSFFSMNFWRHATYSWRRVLDHVTARLVFTIFFLKGEHVKNKFFIFTGHTATVLLLYCYYRSFQNPPNWWKYHMAFHFLTAYNLLIVMDSLV